MYRERSVWKGLVAGLVGGLVGTIVMTESQMAWKSAAKALKNGNAHATNGHEEQQSKEGEQGEDATMKAAGKIAKWSGHELSQEEKKKFGPLVHYSFGTLQGGLYGAITEMAEMEGGFLPALVFGSALFLAADEIAVPALGLSGKPWESPLSGHAQWYALHLAYGVATELTRRGLREAL